MLILSICCANPGRAAELDLDGNRNVDALTDGLMLIRYLFGLTGNSLTANAIGNGATRSSTAINAHLQLIDSAHWDVDGNGSADALTDGLLTIRYLFGLRGNAMIQDAVGSGASLTTSIAIESRIQTLIDSMNQAKLGALSGSIIRAYRLSDLANPIEGPFTSNISLTDVGRAGTFDLQLSAIPDAEWILVTATGGNDIDADDDGVADSSPIPNKGTLYALATAEQWRSGDNKISVLSDIAWRYTEGLINQIAPDELNIRLNDLSKLLLLDDISGDGKIDWMDLLAFDPSVGEHQSRLNFNFQALYDSSVNGQSLIGSMHQADSMTINTILDDLFSSRMSRFPALDIRYQKIKISTNIFGHGSLSSNLGSLSLNSEANPPRVQTSEFFLKSDRQIILTASPTLESKLLGWSGCDTINDQQQCIVSPNQSKNITANFGYLNTQLKSELHNLEGADLIVGSTTILVTIPSTNLAMLLDMLDLQNGDFVVGPSSQGGFLRKVIGYNSTDAQHYQLTTVNANLDELIAQGTGEFKKQLTNGDLEGYVPPNALSSRAAVSNTAFQGQPGVVLIPSDNPDDKMFRLRFGSSASNRQLDARAVNQNSFPLVAEGGITVEATGTIDIEIDIDMGASFGLKGLESFRFIPVITAVEGFSLTANGQIDFKKEKSLGTLRFGRIAFNIGPVPVWITPQVEVIIGAEGHLEANMSMGIEFRQQIKAGIEYSHGLYSIVNQPNVSHTFDPPEVTIQANLSGYLTAIAKVGIYDAIGPEIPVRGGINLKSGENTPRNALCVGGFDVGLYADLNANFQWNLASGSKLGTLLNLEALEASSQFEIYKQEWPIKQWNVGGVCDEKNPQLEIYGHGIIATMTEGDVEVFSTQITLLNPAQALSIPWQIDYQRDNSLIVFPDSGTLAPGESTVVTATLLTTDLSRGIYLNHLSIKNLNNSTLANIASQFFASQKLVLVTVLPEVPPVIPPIISEATAPAGGQVRLDWDFIPTNQPVNFVGYQIYMTSTPQDENSWQFVKTVADINQQSTLITDLPNNQLLSFKMDAYTENGNRSLLSNVVNITTLPTPVLTDFFETKLSILDNGGVPVSGATVELVSQTTQHRELMGATDANGSISILMEIENDHVYGVFVNSKRIANIVRVNN